MPRHHGVMTAAKDPLQLHIDILGHVTINIMVVCFSVSVFIIQFLYRQTSKCLTGNLVKKNHLVVDTSCSYCDTYINVPKGSLSKLNLFLLSYMNICVSMIMSNLIANTFCAYSYFKGVKIC